MKLIQHTKAIFQVLFILLFCTPLMQAQKTVDQLFTKSTTKTISLDNEDLATKSTVFTQSIDLGEYGTYQLSLEQTKLFSDGYLERRANKNDGMKLPLTFKGKIQGEPNTLVSLTTSEGFVSGFIDTGEEVIFFEPYNTFNTSAIENELIIYYQRDVIDQEHTCAANHTEQHTTQFTPQDDQLKSVMTGCYEVEMVLVADFDMYQKRGTNTLSHIMSVLSNTQNNYDDEFNDPITFVVVDDYIATTSGMDLWSSTTNASTLLGEFEDSDISDVAYDLASLWVTRDIFGVDNQGNANNAVAGVANTSGVCSNRYNLIEDYTNSIVVLGALLAHEIGHNFSAEHDPLGSGTIMAPAPSTSGIWSIESQDAINAFYPTATCLCASGYEEPDLAITSCSNGSVDGNILTINGIIIKNIGPLPLPPTQVAWYLSSDNIITTDDYELVIANLPALSPGGFVAPDFPVNLNNETVDDGNYYLGAIADYENLVVELSEENNVCVSSADITIGIPSFEADLVVSSSSVSSSTVACGGSITAYANVSNNGNTSASASTLRYYLSTNNTLDASDTQLASDMVASLPAGATSSQESANLAIPAGLSAGTYYILFHADDPNAIAESDESNNIAAQQITVTCAAPQADLVISSQSLSANTVACGNTMTVDAVVRNDGDGTTTSGSHLRYYLSEDNVFDADDTRVSQDWVGNLAPGATSPETAEFTVPSRPPGTYYIIFRADDLDAISEGNENNNIAVEQITITCTSDLVISSQSLSSNNVSCGSTITADAVVANIGDGITSKGSHLRYYLSNNPTWSTNDIYLGQDWVIKLAAGATSPETAPLTIPSVASGTYYILFRADDLEAVSEGDESNNVAAEEITITCPSDLTISSKSLSTNIIDCGNTITAEAVVINNGDGATTSGSHLRYYLSDDNIFDADDTRVSQDWVGNLAPGATSPETATFTIPSRPPGTYYILFRVDDLDAISESNENNNVAVEQITITCTPDLVVSSSSLSSSSVTCDDVITVDAVVENIGDGVTAKGSHLRYYLSNNPTFSGNDIYLGQDWVIKLTAGSTSPETATLTIPSVPGGTYYILFRADALNALAEGNENNNVAALPITVDCKGLPDLTMASQSVSSNTVACGGTITVDGVVENISNVATVKASHLRYYLSTNMTWDVNDTYLGQDWVINLLAGATSPETANLTIPASLAPGTYYILFRTDDNETIEEIDESNNVSSEQITVTCQPDLIITANSVSSNTVACGNTITASSTVKNDGGSDALGNNMLYYLSTDADFDVFEDTYLNFRVVSELAPNATQDQNTVLSIPDGLSAGTYYILFLADGSDYVSESNENNNIAAQEINITCNGNKESAEMGIDVRNYPDPFSEETTIEFDLPKDTPVTLFVSDMTGRQVAVLIENEQKNVGKHQVTFDGSDYAAGMYYYTIRAGEYVTTQKMILAK